MEDKKEGKMEKVEEEFENKKKKRKRRKLHHIFSGLAIVLGIGTVVSVLSSVDKNLQWLGVILFLFFLGLSAYFLDDDEIKDRDKEIKEEIEKNDN